MEKQKYGLIIPNKPTFQNKKPSSVLKPRLAAFNNEDSSEDEGQKHVNAEIHKEAMKKIVKKQTKLEVQRALEQDATVFEYDNIYDDMKAKATRKTTPKEVQAADKQKKPKYIGSLLKAAEKRNRERQRVEERKIENERKKEGDEFKDKAQFVTSAYRKRMQEREKEEEEERRMAAIEDAMDVRKQKDLSGFYKHLLRQQVGEESFPGEKTSSIKSLEDEKVVDHEEDRDTDLSFSSSSDEKDDSSVSSKGSPIVRQDKSESHSSDDTSALGEKVKMYSQHSSRRTGHYQQRYEPEKNDRRDRDHKRRNDYRVEHYTNRDYEHDGRQSERDTVRIREQSKYSSRSESHDKRHDRNHSKYKPDRSPERKRLKDVRDKSDRDDDPVGRKLTNKDDHQIKSDKDSKSHSENKQKISQKFVKRTDAETVMSARERYLARKKSGISKQAPVEPDSD